MAEERILDEDEDKDKNKKVKFIVGTEFSKEKKYEVVTGVDGESEFIYRKDDYEDEEEEEIGDDMSYELPEDFADDEDFAELSAEQLEEALRVKEAEERQIRERMDELCGYAVEALESGRYIEAASYVQNAEEIGDINGSLTAVKLVAVTSAFSDFTNTKEIIDVANSVKIKTGPESRQRLYDKYYHTVKGYADSEIGQIETLRESNLLAREERRQMILPQRHRAAINFYVTVGVFAVLAIIAIVFSSMMFSVETTEYVICTIVFAACAFVTLIVLIVMARYYAAAIKLYKLNEQDSSTKSGREQTALQEKFNAEMACCEAMDISLDDPDEVPEKTMTESD